VNIALVEIFQCWDHIIRKSIKY